jgi:hypothetical protein
MNWLIYFIRVIISLFFDEMYLTTLRVQLTIFPVLSLEKFIRDEN